MLMHGPVNAEAADEFDAALEALRARFGFGAGPLGLFGGSAGAGVALEVATQRDDVAALVALSPLLQLRPVVAILGELFGVDYRWSPESDAVAARMDYVARVAELGETPVRLVVGSEDDASAFLRPARDLAGHSHLSAYDIAIRFSYVGAPGNASIGICFTASIPKPVRTTAPRNTSSRCRTEKSSIGLIISLLAERLSLGKRTGELKRAAGLPILDPTREAAVIRRVTASARAAGLPPEPIREVFWQIVGMSRREQESQ